MSEKTITREQFNEMTGKQVYEFFQSGGTILVEHEPDPKDTEVMVSDRTGERTTRGEFDRMTTAERTRWLYGDKAPM